MAQALDLVMRGLEVDVGDQQHVDLLTRLDAIDLEPLFVEQEGRHIDRHLRVHGGGVVLHRLFLDHAQDIQRRRFGIADVAGAVAARAHHVDALTQRRAQALARQFHQAEARDLAHLHPRPVGFHRVLELLLDVALVARGLHVDEVDHDQATEVAQAQLARRFLGRFHVGAKRGLLDVAAARGARRVDVDRYQRLGVVDHDRAARGQLHGARMRGLDLVLDLEAREQRRIVAVALDPALGVGHHQRHEGLGLLENVVGIDQDLADVRREIIADRADHQTRFQVDQVRALERVAGRLDRVPQFEQVVQVPLQFRRVAPDAGGAGDQAHAFRILKLVHDLLEFFAVTAFDPARHAAAARIVRHQHQIAAGQGNEGGQRGALVAAFVLFNLYQEFLAFAQRFLDGGFADIDALAEVDTRDFLERQEAVAIDAVVYKTGFERGLDTGDDTLVDVALTLFLPGDFDVQIDQLLAIHDRDAQLFRVRRVE